MTAETGGATEASEEYRRILTDRIRIQGADHPDTLTTRDRLVYWSEQNGYPV
ncbi:hypothetical protein [Arthrobacter sp. SAFR-044]|uniref:hypothetical protein n=1 Tax=Arthrobacter sp. SAFR-044 TaxID=3387278 RepID=UPI003F7BC9EF